MDVSSVGPSISNICLWRYDTTPAPFAMACPLLNPCRQMGVAKRSLLLFWSLWDYTKIVQQNYLMCKKIREPSECQQLASMKHGRLCFHLLHSIVLCSSCSCALGSKHSRMQKVCAMTTGIRYFSRNHQFQDHAVLCIWVIQTKADLRRLKAIWGEFTCFLLSHLWIGQMYCQHNFNMRYQICRSLNFLCTRPPALASKNLPLNKAWNCTITARVL